MAGHLDGAPVLVEAPDARTHQDAPHQRAHRCNKKIDVLVTSLMFNFVTSLQIVLLECVVAISCCFLPLLRFSAIKREALFTHSNKQRYHACFLHSIAFNNAWCRYTLRRRYPILAPGRKRGLLRKRVEGMEPPLSGSSHNKGEGGEV